MRICVDIDGVLCSEHADDRSRYTDRVPCVGTIAKLNALYDVGHHIMIFTARGTLTGTDWRKATEIQLKKWGVKYHELIFGKPAYDIFIDDKAQPSIECLDSVF